LLYQRGEFHYDNKRWTTHSIDSAKKERRKGEFGERESPIPTLMPHTKKRKIGGDTFIFDYLAKYGPHLRVQKIFSKNGRLNNKEGSVAKAHLKIEHIVSRRRGLISPRQTIF